MQHRHDGKRFYNFDVSSNKGKFGGFLKWQFSRKSTKWPKWIENSNDNLIKEKIEGDEIIVTFVNHSTVLIQTQGLNILTDPVWSDRVSPFKWIGPKRIKAPGIKFDSLPKIDFILLSHDHYDHLDMATLKRLAIKFSPTIFCGLKVGNILKKSYNKFIFHEMGWWEHFDYSKDIKIHFLPAKHWSGRSGFFGNNYSLWGSFALQTPGGNIYFAGDTGYSNHFKMIKDYFGGFRLSLLPIGAYEPRWFLKEFHTDPKDAVIAHLDLNSKYSMAIHYGTFKLSDEEYQQPEQDLAKSLEEFNISPEEFCVIREGSNWSVPKI